MNGEVYQISRITAAANKALETSTKLTYVPTDYEKNITFHFLPKRKLFFKKAEKAQNISKWFEICKLRGLSAVELILPTTVKERQWLGFQNTSQGLLVCYFLKKVTFFTADWQYNQEQGAWNITYTEHEAKNVIPQKGVYENNVEAFRSVLMEIRDFAITIDCEGFGSVFQRALDILNGNDNYPDTEHGLPLPSLSKPQLQLFEAASMADVFGAMGSWNDTPPAMAHHFGLEDEYNTLSNELLKQLRYAILYAINS